MASKLTLNDELMFPSDYLSAVEFKGRDVTLTISKVEKAELQMRGGVKKVKPILYFAETAKKLVCNVTNAESIAVLYGSKAETWIGKRVTFYPTTTPVGRRMEPCIRVREVEPPPKGKKVEAQEPPPQEQPQQSGEEFLASMEGQS